MRTSKEREKILNSIKKNYHGNLVMDKLYHFYQNKILYMHPQGKYIAEKRKQELCIFLLQRKSDNTLYSIISIFRTPSSRDRPAQPHLPANKFFPNNVEVDWGCGMTIWWMSQQRATAPPSDMRINSWRTLPCTTICVSPRSPPPLLSPFPPILFWRGGHRGCVVCFGLSRAHDGYVECPWCVECARNALRMWPDVKVAYLRNSSRRGKFPRTSGSAGFALMNETDACCFVPQPLSILWGN